MNFVPIWHTMLYNQQGGNCTEIIDLISLWRYYRAYGACTITQITRYLYEIRSKNEKNRSNILTKLLHTPFIFVSLADEHL